MKYPNVIYLGLFALLLGCGAKESNEKKDEIKGSIESNRGQESGARNSGEHLAQCVWGNDNCKNYTFQGTQSSFSGAIDLARADCQDDARRGYRFSTSGRCTPSPQQVFCTYPMQDNGVTITVYARLNYFYGVQRECEDRGGQYSAPTP